MRVLYFLLYALAFLLFVIEFILTAAGVPHARLSLLAAGLAAWVLVPLIHAANALG